MTPYRLIAKSSFIYLLTIFVGLSEVKGPANAEASLIAFHKKWEASSNLDEFTKLSLKTLPDKKSLESILVKETLASEINEAAQTLDWLRSKQASAHFKQTFANVKKNKKDHPYKTTVQSVVELKIPLAKDKRPGPFPASFRKLAQSGLFRDEVKFYSLWQVNPKYPDNISPTIFFWSGQDWKQAPILGDFFKKTRKKLRNSPGKN